MIKNYYSLRKLGKPYGLTYSKMAGVGLCSLLLCASPQVALADVAAADAIEVVQQTTKSKVQCSTIPVSVSSVLLS